MHTNAFSGRLAAILLAGFMSTATTGSALSADFVMKFTTAPQNDPTHEYMKRYKACLEPASKNRIDVQLYPGAQLGGVGRMIEGLQLGTIEAAILAAQHLKGVDKRYGVVDAPGLFSGIEHANAAYWDPSFREPFLESGKDKGILGFGIFAYGPISFQTKAPITTLADFKGKKVRIVATEIEQGLAGALGAAGIQVDFSDIVPALQRGQIDGSHTSVVIANAAKFFTVAKHTIQTDQTMIAVVPFLSTKFYEKLPKDLQTAVLACGRSVERDMQPVAIEFNTAALDVWKSNGGQVHKLNDADQKKLFETAIQIGEKVLGGDPDLQPLYKALVTAAKKTAPKQ